MIFNAYAEQKETVAGIQFVSCGHIFAKPGREIDRPKGREDWLLFYVAEGEETFFLDRTVTGGAGSFILFAPGEPQRHIHTGSKTAEFYYVHFQCEHLPEEFSFCTSKVYEAPVSRQVCDLFEDIIEETLSKQPFYEKLCVYKLLYLLTALERGILCANHPEREHFEQIARTVQHMNKSYQSDLSLEDYAKMCAMSKYHFLRVFEKIVGSTPIEYRNQIRLQHAAELLLENRHSVEEISGMVGYASVSYFSSAFKQKYGTSPKKYQKQGDKNKG